MSRDADIRHLQELAVNISHIPDRKKRNAAGLWLEGEIDRVDKKYKIIDSPFVPDQAKVEFKAVIQILFDFILYDALEDDDWAMTLPSIQEAGIDPGDIVRESNR